MVYGQSRTDESGTPGDYEQGLQHEERYAGQHDGAAAAGGG